MHRAGCRGTVQAFVQVDYEIIPVGIQPQTVAGLDREQHATGLARHDRRVRVERGQVDQDRALLDVVALVDVRVLVVEHEAG